MFNPYYGLFEYSATDNYTLQVDNNKLTVAMPLRESRERLGREKRGTIDRLEKDYQETRYGAMPDGLS